MFAAMWGAQFVSNTGGWMQTVAAQWLMLTLTSSAAYVALVQTAAGLPVVLFAVLAGTIGDLVDRRRFLLITQSLMRDMTRPRRAGSCLRASAVTAVVVRYGCGSGATYV
jgi:MFS family permease